MEEKQIEEIKRKWPLIKDSLSDEELYEIIRWIKNSDLGREALEELLKRAELNPEKLNLIINAVEAFEAEKKISE